VHPCDCKGFPITLNLNTISVARIPHDKSQVLQASAHLCHKFEHLLISIAGNKSKILKQRELPYSFHKSSIEDDTMASVEMKALQ
jgi:hypothetical protein